MEGSRPRCGIEPRKVSSLLSPNPLKVAPASRSASLTEGSWPARPSSGARQQPLQCIWAGEYEGRDTWAARESLPSHVPALDRTGRRRYAELLQFLPFGRWHLFDGCHYAPPLLKIITSPTQAMRCETGGSHFQLLAPCSHSTFVQRGDEEHQHPHHRTWLLGEAFFDVLPFGKMLLEPHTSELRDLIQRATLLE